ncbi:TIGR00269 family protein [Candidatus Bathyarchaeota archaeon]|nr:TIGR00269 family protein [Candidatus Bathyarchaeota archaeon]
MSTCTLCERREAVFMRPYSGEKLCGRCFCKSIEKKVRATISSYEMLQPKDKIMVAVSGGKDSVTLLHILAKIEKSFPEATLCAVTVDEGIRGYRDEALKFAVKNCRRLGVEHIVTSFKEMYGYKLDELVSMIREKGEVELTPCSYCGVLRRRALNTAAREAGGDKLATAHNLDDETQTMILNILHGDALRIARVKPVLTVVHPKLIQRVKPFCEVPEREIAFYAYMKKIEFQSIPCPYARTALRNDIRTMLNRMEEKHAGTKFTIFKSMERIRPALEAMAEEVKLQECKRCGEPTVGELCRPCQMLEKLSVL